MAVLHAHFQPLKEFKKTQRPEKSAINWHDFSSPAIVTKWFCVILRDSSIHWSFDFDSKPILYFWNIKKEDLKRLFKKWLVNNFAKTDERGWFEARWQGHRCSWKRTEKKTCNEDNKEDSGVMFARFYSFISVLRYKMFEIKLPSEPSTIRNPFAHDVCSPTNKTSAQHIPFWLRQLNTASPWS